MTAEQNIETTEAESAEAEVQIIKFHPTNNTIVNEILEFLAKNPKILFKSQQIDDPEISIDEKMLIAYEILTESHESFLLRFGKYLTMNHLNYFQNCMSSNNYEIQYLIKNLQINMEQSKKNVKNRRFTALKEMIKKNEYFSETEMMKREPHLYEQFIGQYLTDSEKIVRDGFDDPSNTPFSKNLLDGIDRDRTEELRKKQAKYDIDITDESTQKSDISKTINNFEEDDQNYEEMYPKIPASFRKHWGNFEDESNSFDCDRKKSDQKYITASERAMLRQEFVEIMHTKFLEGEDKDFDYSNIDNNTEYDDIEQINQDKEDEYFNEDGNDNENIIPNYDSDDEDDLDVFMKHLNEHPTLKRSLIT